MAGISGLLYFLVIPIQCSEFSGFEKCLVKYAQMASGAPAKNFFSTRPVGSRREMGSIESSAVAGHLAMDIDCVLCCTS